MLQNAGQKPTIFVSFRLNIGGRHTTNAQQMDPKMASPGVQLKLTDQEMLCMESGKTVMGYVLAASWKSIYLNLCPMKVENVSIRGEHQR